jgi:hypothetical protein
MHNSGAHLAARRGVAQLRRSLARLVVHAPRHCIEQTRERRQLAASQCLRRLLVSPVLPRTAQTLAHLADVGCHCVVPWDVARMPFPRRRRRLARLATKQARLATHTITRSLAGMASRGKWQGDEYCGASSSYPVLPPTPTLDWPRVESTACRHLCRLGDPTAAAATAAPRCRQRVGQGGCRRRFVQQREQMFLQPSLHAAKRMART